jgi:hypothetical protein
MDGAESALVVATRRARCSPVLVPTVSATGWLSLPSTRRTGRWGTRSDGRCLICCAETNSASGDSFIGYGMEPPPSGDPFQRSTDIAHPTLDSGI